MGRDDGPLAALEPGKKDEDSDGQGKVPQTQREPESFRRLPEKFSPLQDLLVNKVFATITGWLLSNALRLTVLYAMVGGQEAIMVEKQRPGLQVLSPAEKAVFRKFKNFSFPRIGGVVFQALIFVVMLSSSAGLAALARKGKGFHSLRKTYAQSLSYIPAWAWKDFLNDSIAILLWRHKGAQNTLTNTIWLAVACVLSGLLQWLAETLLLRMRQRTRKGCFFAHCRQAMLMLDTSLGLGCGFALNQVFKHFWADFWQELRFQILYVIAMSFWIPLWQRIFEDWEDTHRDYNEVLLRMVSFAILAGNFALGWAWKALLDALCAQIGTPGFLHTALSSILITVGGVFVVWFLARRGHKPSVIDSASLIVGMNIGWTWMDFMAASFFGQATMTLTALWVVTILNQVFILGLALAFIAMRPLRDWAAWWHSQEDSDGDSEEEVKKEDNQREDGDGESSDGGDSTGGEETDSMVEGGGGAASRP